MKRILTLTLALLLAVSLASFGGVNPARAEEENPYVGLWEITGQQEGETYTSYAEVGVKAYLDFLPSGAIYAVMVSDGQASPDYLAYQVTGENTLDLYEGEDGLPGVYDPEAGVITVTDTGSGLLTFVERVKEDPLPDIRALAADPDEEQTYYGYAMTQNGQTANMLETLPPLGMDPRDYYLTLEPDGTGYMQLGSEEVGGEITWTETEFVAEGESVTYTREGDHILVSIDESNGIEFAPEDECEALLAMKGIEVADPAETIEAVDIDPEDVAGEWTLYKVSAAGQTLSAEQVKAQGGTSLSFTFNADGTAIMVADDDITDGFNWAVEDGEIFLTIYSVDLFTFIYDGEYLVLDMDSQGQLYFEKVS